MKDFLKDFPITSFVKQKGRSLTMTCSIWKTWYMCSTYAWYLWRWDFTAKHYALFCLLSDWNLLLVEFTGTIDHEADSGRTMTEEESIFGYDKKSIEHVWHWANYCHSPSGRSAPSYQHNSGSATVLRYRTWLQKRSRLHQVNPLSLLVWLCSNFQGNLQCAEALQCQNIILSR